MAVYDLFDSIRDASTLGRYDNSVLKRVFGVNGILDAVNDVRESISTSYVHGNRVKTKISPDSIVGKIINKIPDSARKNLVKIIDNPAVRSITFITIAYQFGYSVKEIVGGNHYPLNYYWAGSSSIKLASMSIRPIAIRVSAVGGRFIRVLSVASKLLGKLSIVTGIADIIITAAIDMHQAKEYLDEVSSHIPLSSPEKYNLFLEKSWSADLYSSCTLIGSIGKDVTNDKYENMFLSCFSMLKRLFTGSNTLSQSYENAIKVKNQLNIIKETAITKLICHSDLRAIVQYTPTIGGKEYEVLTGETEDEYGVLFVHPDHKCTTKTEYGDSYYFDLYDESVSLSSLNISDSLPIMFNTLNGVGVYVNIEHKHIPHLTVKEYEDGYRIIDAPQSFKHSKRCSEFSHLFKRSLANDRIYPTNRKLLDYKDEHKEPFCIESKVREICRENFPPYEIFERRKVHDNQEALPVALPILYDPYKKQKPYCPKGEVRKVCTETFDISHEPFIIANDLRKRGDIFYSLVPRNFTAAENYPAVIVLPKGEVNCTGSKNHETVFLISQSSGNLEGAIRKKNTVVIHSDDNIKAELDRGILEYGKNKINLKNIYNLIINSSGEYNITTHCNTKFISTNSVIGSLALVYQGQSKCSATDYEVRKVAGGSDHYRGLKQTTFIIDKGSHGARIFSSKDTENKRNIDVISVKSNIVGLDKNEDINVTICPTVLSNEAKYDIKVAILKVRKNGSYYVLDLLDNHEKIISSICIENVKNLQVEKDGYYYKIDVDAMKLERILPALEDVIMDYPLFLTRYQPDREHGLQIYRDGDSNIGLVDLRDKSTLDFNIEIIGDSLVLLYKGNRFVKIENWTVDQSTRETILIFSDAQIFDLHCIYSNCDPRGIVKEFNQVLEFLKNNPNTQKYISSSEVVCKTIKERKPCDWLEGVFTSKCEPTGFLSGYHYVNEREECVLEVPSNVERDAKVNALTADGRTPYDLAINQNDTEIKEYLRSKSAVSSSMLISHVIPVDDSVRQRKRRHHHGDHNYHHLSHKSLATDLSNQPEIATSSAIKPSSWINGLLGWVKSSIGGLVSSVADKFAAEESENSKLGDTVPCSAGLEKMYSATILQSRKSLDAPKGNIPNRSWSSNREKVRSNVTVVPEINTAVVDSALILGDLAVRFMNGTSYQQPIHENLLSPREQSMRSIDEDMIIRAIQQGKEKFGVPDTNMDEVEIIGNKTEIGK
ncbi:MAG: hypothetical protein AB3P11_07940 [Wolbachia pipientis]